MIRLESINRRTFFGAAAAIAGAALWAALMRVPVDGHSPLTLGTPAKILDGSYVWAVPTYAGRQYDISPDGARFLRLKYSGRPDQRTEPTTITIVQNWFEELKRLVPTN